MLWNSCVPSGVHSFEREVQRHFRIAISNESAEKLGIFSSGAPLKTVADLSAVERYFVVLKWKDQVPYLASCARCGHKFFTPNGRFRNDPVGAEEYLRDKYVRHECKTEPKK